MTVERTSRPTTGGSLGFVVATYDDGAVIVDDVVGGGVAEGAGVRKGHEILLINGKSVLGTYTPLRSLRCC